MKRRKSPASSALKLAEKANRETLEDKPATRRLQIYAIDPSADTSITTAGISRCTLPIRGEKLDPGPVGDYVEVVDVDPSSGCIYEPVDLNQLNVVASDGLAPSEGSPQFHQQMVYAVAMKTIENFERALGRKILWSPRLKDEKGNIIRKNINRYIPRLRIYPHALREPNAYYSPAKKALLFGYFNAQTTDPREELPGGMVFSCLSHDIIAHETTHAILDGINRRLLEATNEDMLAFHEAFADVVAIFQHFTLPGLVLDQMQRTRGALGLNNLLATLAVQFGRATRLGGALRNALGRFDKKGRRLAPDPAELSRTIEPHARGAILVAAVFDAFLMIYESRVSDLRRIATGGTGILAPGDIHPDLARRFADEAVKAAQRVLTICIRALDYLPPVDITFGDYLRALITADADLVPDDPQRYRLAFIEAFRNRGIYPQDVRALGEDSLRWRPIPKDRSQTIRKFIPPADVLRTMVAAWEFSPDPTLDNETEDQLRTAQWRENLDALREVFLKAYWGITTLKKAPDNSNHRLNMFLTEQQFARFLYFWLAVVTWQKPDKELRDASNVFGVDFIAFRKYLDSSGKRGSIPGAIQVHSVRPTFRVQPDGRTKIELLVILMQRCDVKLKEGDSDLEFPFRGGSTLIIDPQDDQLRYSISKNIRFDKETLRQEKNMAFLRDRLASLGPDAWDYYRLHGENRPTVHIPEALARLHRDTQEGGW
jgi:hypothetical protein